MKSPLWCANMFPHLLMVSHFRSYVALMHCLVEIFFCPTSLFLIHLPFWSCGFTLYWMVFFPGGDFSFVPDKKCCVPPGQAVWCERSLVPWNTSISSGNTLTFIHMSTHAKGNLQLFTVRNTTTWNYGPNKPISTAICTYLPQALHTK